MKVKNLPGSIFLRNSRYFWKVKLPGSSMYQQVSLKPKGADLATKDFDVAVECARQMYNEALLSQEPSVDDYSLAGICRAYMASLPNNSKQISNYKICVNYLLECTDGTIPAYEFTPRMLRLYQFYLADKNLSETTVNKHAANARRVFKWAVTEGLVPSSVFLALGAVSGIKACNTNAKPRRIVREARDEDIEATLPYLSQVLQDMVKVHRITGMRSSELVIMRGDMIDRSESTWDYDLQSKHKTSYLGKERIIPLGKRVQEIITPYILKARGGYLFRPAESLEQFRQTREDRRKTPLSCGNRAGTNCRGIEELNECYSSGTYRKAIERAVKLAMKADANVQRWTPHMLRHAAGTEITELMGLEAASGQLGHSGLGVTQRYAHIGYKQARRVAEQMG